MTRDIDWALFEKAVDITASALRGSLGGDDSKPASYAGEVFTEVWKALKAASADLNERGRAGF